MNLQIPYQCKKYKPNENLNKTCDNKVRCKVYYDEVCKEYKDETCNNNSISDYNGSNGDFPVCLNKKIDKLIEINTPEYINVLPDEIMEDLI